MSSNLEAAHIERSPVALTPVDIRSGQILQAALASLWRRKLLLAALTATSLALGIIALLAMPARYSAEIFIRGLVSGSNAVVKDDTNANASPLGLDLARVLETQTRLLNSYQLAQRVVEQLGLDRLQPELDESPSLLARFFPHPANPSGQQEDRIASKILRNLSVTSDPRAYLITVEYTDRDPQLAALIANAFVAEFLRSTKLQMLSQQRSTAQAALIKQLAKFGDKHPRVAEARLGVAAFDDLMKGQLDTTPESILQAAGENVTKAIVGPAGPKTHFVIGLSLLIGLMFGVGTVLWLERNRWWAAFSQYYAGPFA